MAQVQSLKADELPRSFVDAMRVLFQIMDHENTGFIKYLDIEKRWQDDGTQELPKNVLENLKKVTPSNGLLTFERLCTGLKICLEQKQKDMESSNSQSQFVTPFSASNLTINSPMKNLLTSPNTATIRPNNAILQQRTFSMPQLSESRNDSRNISLDMFKGKSITDVKSLKMFGPPKPPRTGAATDGRLLNADRNFDKSEIRTTLHNWQVGLMLNEEKCLQKKQISNANYNVDSRSLLKSQKNIKDDKLIDIQSNHLGISQKKITSRKKESRRHTLQNGIDFNMMKRIKQIEEEKNILLQGFGAIEKARDWYLKQISTTQDKIKHLGEMASYVEQWTESQQERLELQRARILEVNRHLAALINSWERGGLPLHMNLAFLNRSSTQINQDILTQLKHQNYTLTEEVNKQNYKIALLEQEKDNLMRELYNQQRGIIQSRRSTMIHEQHDQTFII
ncbi:suppressor APC domain-containing protein 2 isoform X1 [Microplitis demolitor]|uniref:suppressor APC domain-containing protein 2 isoform X1 n=1 Tax=Microplitis demolitor TaxID=69319 RepID=UPI0004CCF526|nr:suppressor APC domain-containing protein 2 isoform X1 [Microplitis demolitor]XP_008554263.1 suppressor APC domain-containing protein 2 isoform X1 [Microplitis demolitor]XP_014298091.1 suppressor APC domain-containing protein 2 isoform X1 [Microplitis demolitor]XP_053594382.1 suppressor APC domain-containing protein 2 isoform X1 [Microplitis demolitor]XP_053594383.1 suppressor APC domain-containing protein 2 isoform X1 [Microplitis demolitor]XP_053594384.1 suppressor APC domain-containing pr